MKKLTQDEFIARARSVHGARYDYSKVEYRGRKDKVRIICPVHGEFLQTPDKHLSGCGCSNPECVRAKVEATTMCRYGVRNVMQSDVGKDAYSKSCMEKYGVAFALSSPVVHAKQEATMLARYGAKSGLSAGILRDKGRVTIQERYGVTNPMHSPELSARFERTMMERYGVKSALSVGPLRDKGFSTIQKRYGVVNPMHCRDIQDKVFSTRKANGTLNTSEVEGMLHNMLCEAFGERDVIREYKCPLYPWHCDFYIRSRNMYIELNASWTHMGHWYDGSDQDDVSTLANLKAKSVDSDYYKNAVRVWTDYDVRKRAMAAKNHLNYVVFWDNGLLDANLWFAEGCPDGHDYERPYSWLDI